MDFFFWTPQSFEAYPLQRFEEATSEGPSPLEGNPFSKLGYLTQAKGAFVRGGNLNNWGRARTGCNNYVCFFFVREILVEIFTAAGNR